MALQFLFCYNLTLRAYKLEERIEWKSDTVKGANGVGASSLALKAHLPNQQTWKILVHNRT